MKPKPAKARPRRRRLGALLRWAALAVVALYAFWIVSLVALRFIDPPFTAVQLQRRIQALVHHRRYQKKYTFVPLERISPNLQHAAVAAEDTRFYQHHGIDFQELNKVVEDDLDEGKLGRGGSTITQQLVKNLFLTTGRSLVRKGIEFTLAPLADRIVGKQRTLELYLNVVEWGPGVYGAEAAARYHYGVPASRLSRDQAARLAALLPAPLTRKPGRMDHYSAVIENRMRSMGW